MRECGILLPIASLPSKYGIGAFSREAYEFVDQLKEAGQSYWQILPLGPTGYGDSPYQSFSAFAGNPYFIDLEQLTKDGFLTEEECRKADFGGDETSVDYEKIYNNRFPLLKTAFLRWKAHMEDANVDMEAVFERELIQETRNYCFYAALKRHFQEKSWILWDRDIRLCKREAVEKYKKLLAEEICFYEFQQLMFLRQWKKLKAYANKQGIRFIGDIPIYVAFDSADSWSHPELFQFDEENRPKAVAGCPPDAFSATGQLWGNPLYDWDYHKKTGYEWWAKRIAYSFKLYDKVRIDHFRGFDEYYTIPYGDETAVNGCWKPGPGIEFFRAIEGKLGKLDIIAEDLGYLTDTVLQLLKDTGFPGMKVIQFAFDSREAANYLPHTYIPNCVVYTGTHDNDTTRGWYHNVGKECRDFAKEYLRKPALDEDTLSWDFIAMAMSSVADLCVIPIQDFLCLDEKARINIPSTLGNNWVWRLKKGQITEKLTEDIYKMTKMYGRTAVKAEKKA